MPSQKNQPILLSCKESKFIEKLGESLDIGICCGSLNGTDCKAIVNKNKSKYCGFHTDMMYKAAQRSRPDLNSGKSKQNRIVASRVKMPKNKDVLYMKPSSNFIYSLA